MRAGVRFVALMGAALALCGQAPKQAAKSDQQKPQTQQAQSAPAIATDSKTVEPIQPPEYYRPCQKDRNDGDSDLCAQWTAAHGAENAAYWAKLSFWFGLLGLGGLIATLYYTRKAVLAAEEGTKDADAALAIARENADAAKDQAKIARDAMEGQLRPWITFTVAQNAKLWIDADVLELVAEVSFKNIGSSPAIDVTYMGTMIFGDEVAPTFKSLVRHLESNDPDWADKTLFPEEKWGRSVGAVHTGKREGVHEITFVLIARYRTPFSETYRFTGRAFDVGLTTRNNHGEIVPIGDRKINIAVVEREIVKLAEKQHFSGYTS